MRAAGALRVVVAAGLLTLAAAGAAPLVPAQTADGAGSPPDAAQPLLPQPAGRIGRLKRDPSGRIVPTGPLLPAEETPRGGLLAPGGIDGVSSPPPLPSIASFDPQILDVVRSRGEHEMRARRLQAEIDRVLAEEREARDRGGPANAQGRTAREDALARELERLDREVREHEMLHYHTGQPWTRFPEYFEVTGPGARRYAVSGITPMDASAVDGDPDATVRKLETLIRAALAPREPSEEDKRVAAALEQLIVHARRR